MNSIFFYHLHLHHPLHHLLYLHLLPFVFFLVLVFYDRLYHIRCIQVYHELLLEYFEPWYLFPRYNLYHIHYHIYPIISFTPSDAHIKQIRKIVQHWNQAMKYIFPCFIISNKVLIENMDILWYLIFFFVRARIYLCVSHAGS